MNEWSTDLPNSSESNADQALPGGWQTQVRRVGDTIRREPRAWSRSVLHFLNHLAKAGFDGSPRPVGTGFDDDGNEVLTFMPGESLQPEPWSDAGIVALGKMLSRFHRAAGTYQPEPTATWQSYHSDALTNTTGFGHGDLGPWNIMAVDGLPVGFIDWDTAGPLDPVWEVAHVAWLNAQLHGDDVAALVGLGSPEQRAAQLALLLNAYGLETHDRVGFVDKMIEIAIRDAATQAEQHDITPETTVGVAAGGYPFAWGIAWRTRSAAWMLEHRALLESAIT